jgi:hypothetical protein
VAAAQKGGQDSAVVWPKRLVGPFVYYAMVVWRAVRDTVRHFKTQIAVSAVLFLLGTWRRCASLPKGRRCDLSDFHAGLWAVALWIGGVLAFNLLMAPFRVHRELAQLVPAKGRVLLLSPPYNSPAAGQPRWRFHIYAVNEGIMLVWSRWWARWLPPSAMCWVEDPYGNHRIGRFRHTGDALRCIYPQDFDVEEPQQGEHRVQWFARAEELSIGQVHPDAIYIEHAHDFVIDVEPK